MWMVARCCVTRAERRSVASAGPLGPVVCPVGVAVVQVQEGEPGLAEGQRAGAAGAGQRRRGAAELLVRVGEVGVVDGGGGGGGEGGGGGGAHGGGMGGVPPAQPGGDSTGGDGTGGVPGLVGVAGRLLALAEAGVGVEA